MRERPDLKTVSDDKLLRGLFEVLKQTRHDEADLIAHIAEVDARRLYAREASPSMHAYCIEVLHLSEPETALRIHVARATRTHPMLLEMLRYGRIHLSGIALLAPHLTDENRRSLLQRATHKSKRQIEEIVAELRPRPDAPARIRKLPARRAEGTGCVTLDTRPGLATEVDGEHRPDDVGPADPGHDQAEGHQHRLDDAVVPPPPEPCRRATVEPLAPARYQVRFTASQQLRDKLERLQALMRSSVPDGDLAKVIDVAVTRELERLEARRFGKVNKPRKRVAQADTRPKSRYIPAAVRRLVAKRDGGRCTFRDRHGRRCTQRHDLEFHHRNPFGLGGDHRPEGLALMCRTHNALLAEQDFGGEKMARYRRRASSDTGRVHVVGAGTGESVLRAQWRSTG